MEESQLGSEEPPIGEKESRQGPNRTLVAGIIIGLAVAAIVVVLVVAGGDDEGGGSSGSSSVLPEGCEEVEAPEPKQVSLDRPADLDAVGGTAVVETNCGSFQIALDAERAPLTVASFENLVNQGFYDGTAFHRIVPDFVIQGGDPLGDGTGGPGYSIDEPPPEDLAYTQGIVAMAKTEAEPPGRSGSQFFVVLGADAGLPPDFALVGEVTEGFDVVERIAGLGDEADPAGTPLAPVVIERITLEPA